MRTKIGMLCLALTAATACGPDSEIQSRTPAGDSLPSAERPPTSGDLIGGIPTTLRPEVGLVSVPSGPMTDGHCTGTLVDPSWVLTAAHCITGSNDPLPSGSFHLQSTFTITAPSGVKKLKVDRGFSLSTSDLLSDVALFHLETPVSAADASPAGIAWNDPPGQVPPLSPSNGQLPPLSTYFGFGCQDRVTASGRDTKRWFLFPTQTTTTNFCWGDSGGPAFFSGPTEGGKIWGVLTGNAYYTNDDIISSADIAIPGLAALKDMAYTDVTNVTQADLANLGLAAGAQAVSGDFDGDGLSDIAFIGPLWFHIVPVAFSNADGTFRLTTQNVPNLPMWNPLAQAVSGDFNGDHLADIALVGGAGWNTVPVAFSVRSGSFNVVNLPSVSLAAAATGSPGFQAVAGDFDHDGFTDIALVGGGGTIGTSIGRSLGDGTFAGTLDVNPQFASWATGGAKALAGDFDGDGDADIALVDQRWFGVVTALSQGNGHFVVVNIPFPDLGDWGASSGPLRFVAGDFNGDNRDDIAALGVSDPLAPRDPNNSWDALSSVYFALGTPAPGLYTSARLPLATFPALARSAPIAVVGRFGKDKQADIALLGIPGTVPVALIRKDPPWLGASPTPPPRPR